MDQQIFERNESQIDSFNILKHQLKNQNFISKTKLTFNEIKNIIKWYDLKRGQRMIRQTTQPDLHNEIQKQLMQQGIIINELQKQVNQQQLEFENLKKSITIKQKEQINGFHQKSKSSCDEYLDQQIKPIKQHIQIINNQETKTLEQQIKNIIQQELDQIYKLLTQQLKTDVNEIIFQTIQEQFNLSNNNSPKPDTLRKYSQSKMQSENDSQQNINVIVECLNEQIDELQNNNIFENTKNKMKTLKVKQIIKLYEEMEQQFKDQDQIKQFIGPKLQLKQYVLHKSQGNILEYVNKYQLTKKDNNNFYTTFGYQYMDIILTHADDQNFETFMENIKGIPFELHSLNYDISKEEQQELKQIFCFRCIELRQIQISQRSNELLFQMSDTNNSFYGLTMIFIRNLINQILQQSEINQQLSEEDQQQLCYSILDWSQPCQETDLLMEVLAHELEICIILYYLYDEKDEFYLRIFGDESNYQIHILQHENQYFSIATKDDK